MFDGILRALAQLGGRDALDPYHLQRYAEVLELDIGRFTDDLRSGRHVAAVRAGDYDSLHRAIASAAGPYAGVMMLLRVYFVARTAE